MMNCIAYLDDLARGFADIISLVPDVKQVPTKDYGWTNHRWTSPWFRMAHVEVFNQDRFMVVHCCVFPHVHDPSPIFGFDAIAGEHKVTGLFWDLSPTIGNTVPFCGIQGLVNRDRPEWGDIFSEHWVACRPSPDQLVEIGTDAAAVLCRYLRGLNIDQGDALAIASAQDRYCLQQRKNEHTRRAIVNLLGQDLADEFITTVLFPVTEQHNH
jgi:phycocyanobilin:ferredoxin oxidoreductase